MLPGASVVEQVSRSTVTLALRKKWDKAMMRLTSALCNRQIFKKNGRKICLVRNDAEESYTYMI